MRVPWQRIALRYVALIAIREALYTKKRLRHESLQVLLGALGAAAVVKSVGGWAAYLTWVVTGRSSPLCRFGRYAAVAPFGHLAPAELRDALTDLARNGPGSTRPASGPGARRG